MSRFLTSALLVTFAASFSFAFDHSHNQFDQLMKQYNKDGRINYKTLKTDSKTLDIYLSSIAKVDPVKFKSWSKNEQITFYVNAYNAYTLKAIITNYPIKSSFLKSRIYPKNSIRQIDGVWDEFQWDVHGKKMTLNDIEHETLRKNYNEPRIHMALVCAAISCPPLRGEAYTSSKLSEQFDDQTRSFLSNPETFQIDEKNKKLLLSSIFDWFGEDFVNKYSRANNFPNRKKELKSVLNFVSQFLSGDKKTFVLSDNYKVDYLKYDWSLNEQ